MQGCEFKTVLQVLKLLTALEKIAQINGRDWLLLHEQITSQNGVYHPPPPQQKYNNGEIPRDQVKQNGQFPSLVGGGGDSAKAANEGQFPFIVP